MLSICLCFKQNLKLHIKTYLYIVHTHDISTIIHVLFQVFILKKYSTLLCDNQFSEGMADLLKYYKFF